MNNNLFRTVLTALIFVLLLGYGFTSWKSHQPKTSGSRVAIYLADGQTYFGYASSLNNNTVMLTDVYFLRVPTASTGATPAAGLQKVDLIKLGLGGDDDLVGSKDKMEINRDAIKYVQEMKDDSQVNQKIADYLKKQAGN